jgi:hypothetical protein
MTRIRIVVATLVAVLLLPLLAGAVVEPKTGTEYPDRVDLELGDATMELRATGVGLREKTFMKVDVYTIVSYVAAGTDLSEDPAATLRSLEAPRRIRMDLRRGFSREKLVNSFNEVIEKNYEDMSAFIDDLGVFMSYFDRDAQENDVLIFDYVPGTGLTTTLNGEVKGTIANADFAQALWTVWFGEKPADKGLREALLSAG